MGTTDQLAAVVEELIDVLHRQAEELVKLIAHVEQVTTRLPEANQMTVIASELSALHLRARKLRGSQGPASR